MEGRDDRRPIRSDRSVSRTEPERGAAPSFHGGFGVHHANRCTTGLRDCQRGDKFPIQRKCGSDPLRGETEVTQAVSMRRLLAPLLRLPHEPILHYHMRERGKD